MIIYLYLFIKINLSNKYKTIIFIEYDLKMYKLVKYFEIL